MLHRRIADRHIFREPMIDPKPSPAARATRQLTSDAADIAQAAAVLKAGGLVAFPTETVYGLGADARSEAAVAAIYAAKHRPRFNPLIAHFASVEAARAEAAFGPDAAALAEAFWPGPLTLVVPAGPQCSISELARAGLPSIALRVPRHPVARALIEAAGCPLVAPSANRSGRISPTEASHVLSELDGRIDCIIDGGPTELGLESTVVSCLDVPRLMRPGGITRVALEAVLGCPLGAADPNGTVSAPGMLASHYAPNAAVRLGATTVWANEAVLDFAGKLKQSSDGPYLDLSPCGDLIEAAANLFGFLRRLDGSAGTIAVAPIPSEGVGDAINDRLVRAAASRDQA